MNVERVLANRLFTIGDTSVNVATALAVGLVLVATFWGSRLLRRAVDGFLLRRGMSDAGSRGAAARLVHYLALGVGFGVALRTLGLDLTTLFAAGAFLAIGIGFAMQNITQNFVSGIILLVERTIKPGDILEVDGQMVRVTHMGIRATVARTLKDEDIILPNSELAQTAVKNFTLRDSLYRLRTKVGVAYDSDMTLVERVLTEAATTLGWRSPLHDPSVLLLEFGDSAVVWDVSVWMDSPFQARGGRSDLNKAIWNALKDAGVRIAFPQMDVHLDRVVVDTLRSPRA
jgi:potassium-dependent mechanosensitive channel